MIQSVTIVNPKNEELKIQLDNPETSGIIIESIDGLGPSQANINSYEVATTDGSIFTSARMTERNIVFDLIMHAITDIEESRLKIYRFFPIKKKIKMIFETDHQYRWTEGYVERNEPNIFSDRESTQISIICPKPYFYTVGEEAQVFSGVRSLFEFPFSNESLTDDLLEFSEVVLDTRVSFDYEGDVDTGILITIHCLEASKNIILYNVDTREQMTINTDMIAKVVGAPIQEGDDIIISTVSGEKYARFLHSGVYTNIISAIDKDSEWFQISPGPNTFDFKAETGQNSLLITMTYNAIYGGI